MSKIKSPQQKKSASLALDRRNVYGENDKASRKLIPRRKQEANQELRRAANQPLRKIAGAVDEDASDQVEANIRTALIDKRRKTFKKSPDAPLGNFLVGRKSKKYPDTKHGPQLSNRLIKF